MDDRNLGVVPAHGGKYIFISYNREDAPIVRRYTVALRKLGVRLWYDLGIVSSSKITWANQIEKHIEDCEGVVMFLSRGIFRKNDSYVVTEYNLARAYNKEIVFVACNEINDNDVNVIDGRYVKWWNEVTSFHLIPLYKNNLDPAEIAAAIATDEESNYRFPIDGGSYEKDMIPFDESGVSDSANNYSEEFKRVLDEFTKNERLYHSDTERYYKADDIRKELSLELGHLVSFSGDITSMNNTIVTLGQIRKVLKGAESSFYWKYYTSKAIEERLTEASLIRQMILKYIGLGRQPSDDLYKIVKVEYKNDLEQLLSMFDREIAGRGPEKKKEGRGILRCLFGR